MRARRTIFLFSYMVGGLLVGLVESGDQCIPRWYMSQRADHR